MSKMSLQKSLAGLLISLASLCAHGAINLADPIPLNPLLKTGKLANGLTYYILKNGKPEQRVELRLVVKAGSVLEDDDQQGLAHFTEHLGFDGSRHFEKHELISYLQSIGVSFGADLNAYTSFDETVYILPIPTDKKENLETGFQVLEDWAQGVSMKDDAIELERPVVLEEARLRKGAGQRISEALMPILYNGAKYADRLPIGKEELLKTFKYDTVRRFYKDWYRPDLEAVVVVGDVDPEQAEKMIRAHFSSLKNPVNERPRPAINIPAREASSVTVVTDKEATNNVLQLFYSAHAVPPDTTLADSRRDLVRNLFTSMLATRLQELTLQANPPFLTAWSNIGTTAPGYEAYSAGAILGRGGVEPAIAAVAQENERARRNGFAAAEFERSKKNLIRAYENNYNERDKMQSSSLASELIRNFLVRESVPGVEAEYHFVQQVLPGITLEEVNRYASENIPSKAVKAVVYSGVDQPGTAIPKGDQLLAMVDAAEAAPLVAKLEKTLPAQLMTNPPKGGSIVAESHNKELGLDQLTLSNGVKVILKKTDFQNDQVLLGAGRFGGQSLFEEKDKFTARYANSVAWTMGLADYSADDVRKILAGKTAHLQTNIGFYQDSYNGSASTADVESLFQLLYLRMTSPRKDQVQFDSFVSKQQDAVKSVMAQPEAVFQDASTVALYGEHPRLQRIARPEDFSKIDEDRALSIFGQRMASAKDLTFVMVGNVDTDKLKPLIARYLGSLPTPELAENFRDLGIRPVTGVVKKEVHTGQDPKSRVSLTFTGPAHYSREEYDRMAMVVDIMKIKAVEVLREKMSLIYGAGMSASINRVPYVHYNIAMTLPCAPENVDKVIATTFAEIDKIKNEGPQQADIDKVKKNWLEGHAIEMRTNGYWLSHLQDSILFGTDPAEILTFEKRINSVTKEQLQEAAKLYFNDKKLCAGGDVSGAEMMMET